MEEFGYQICPFYAFLDRIVSPMISLDLLCDCKVELICRDCPFFGLQADILEAIRFLAGDKIVCFGAVPECKTYCFMYPIVHARFSDMDDNIDLAQTICQNCRQCPANGLAGNIMSAVRILMQAGKINFIQTNDLLRF